MSVSLHALQITKLSHDIPKLTATGLYLPDDVFHEAVYQSIVPFTVYTCAADKISKDGLF